MQDAVDDAAVFPGLIGHVVGDQNFLRIQQAGERQGVGDPNG
jgi:hypothetical protein